MTSVPSGAARSVNQEGQTATETAADLREEERRLVQRATGRDTTAFAELYDKHVIRVYRHTYYMVNDAREAEDLTAQTFLKAWEAIERYKERGAPFVAWLLRIAHNLTISHLRSKREHSVLEDYYVDQKIYRNPEQALEQSNDESSVREAVLKLRDEQRQVIMLRFVEELDYQEVAAVIGKSIPAVRVIQHRALANLRKHASLAFRPGRFLPKLRVQSLYRCGDLMEQKELARMQLLSEEQVQSLTAKIRPLPENVVPSERFREQMRLRLLDLQPRQPKQAA